MMQLRQVFPSAFNKDASALLLHRLNAFSPVWLTYGTPLSYRTSIPAELPVQELPQKCQFPG